MSLIKHLDHSGQWAQQKVTEALSGRENEIIPADITGLFVLLLCLNESADRYAGLPLEGIRIDTADKRLDIQLVDNGKALTHPDHTDQVITRFVAGVSTLNFGPSGWVLNIMKTGESFSLRTLELPNYEDI